jgi:hypothetical protein
MSNLKLTFIFAIITLSTTTLEMKESVVSYDNSDCNESPEENFASLQIYFITEMSNGLNDHKVGAAISIPCEKRENFQINFISDAISGEILNLDDEMKTMYNGAYTSNSIIGESMYVSHVEKYTKDMNGPVVKIDVEIKLDSANVTLYVGNSFMFKTLEEYGVAYQFGKSTYEISEEMKEKLPKASDEKTEQEEVEVINMTEQFKQELMKKIMNGQSQFEEVDGDKKIQVTVQRKIFKQNPDGSVQEIDML